MGLFAESKSAKNFLIRLFIKKYNVDMTEARNTSIDQYRNFNAFFKKEFKSNSISPLVYDGINLNSNTIVPEANDLLKRQKRR